MPTKRSNLVELEEVKNGCYDKMVALNPKLFIRLHFLTYYKKKVTCSFIISKSFYGRILEVKDKYNLTMLKWIRCYWMIKFHENRIKGEKMRKLSLKWRIPIGQIIISLLWNCKLEVVVASFGD
ncbi:hypothetical protein CR513_27616, partial [Mucuna pruriens]